MKKHIGFNAKKEQTLLIVLKNSFLTDDQFCLWQKNGTFIKKNQCQTSKK